MCSDLRNWPIFSSLEPKFVSQIHMVLVYGELGNEALIVTKDKMVYAMGNGLHDCLGTGDANSTPYLKKVEDLCEKGIKTFACAFGSTWHYVMALTKEGNVYTWGYNKLSDGTVMYSITPTWVNIQDVVDVACGNCHSVALTKDGKVYAWGSNINKPIHIMCGKDVKKTVYVSCGGTFTMVIIETGEVYGFGYNDVGQLGIPVSDNGHAPPHWPQLVELLEGHVVVKVACGYEHTLALTDEGKLYTWGRNDYGQLGNGKKLKYCEPAMIKHKREKMKWTDVAALHCSNISIAVDEEDRVYVWGDCRGQNILTPTVTSLSNVHDAIAFYGPNVMHKPLVLYANKESDILECLKTAFDDPSTSDLKIQVEGQYIHVHKTILKIRSSYFRRMFQHNLAEKNHSIIKHDQFSYVIYKAFLKYLYTDIIDLPSEKASELLDLAEEYCESNLKQYCIQLIKQQITISNVMLFYDIAVKYNSEELEELCVKFGVDHLTAVTQTEGFSKLDSNTLRTFIKKVGKAGGFRK